MSGSQPLNGETTDRTAFDARARARVRRDKAREGVEVGHLCPACEIELGHGDGGLCEACADDAEVQP